MKTDSYNRVFKNSPMCIVLIAINFLIYLLIKGMPWEVDLLALHVNPTMTIQRPWTLITSFFVHDAGIHIMGTMLIVFYAGSKLEIVVGSRKIAKIFLISGLSGSLVFLFASMLLGQMDMAVGASAAALGILGSSVMVPLEDINRSLSVKKIIIVVTITNLFMLIFNRWQFAASTLAHFSGMLTGMGLGYWIKKQMPVPVLKKDN